MVKVRIPSPTREAGDGMEASKTSSPNNNLTQDSLTNSSVTESVKLIKSPLIKLPQLDRNISMEKLPPITDDKVKLKITQPTSPLVPLLTGQPAVSRSFQGNKKEKIAKFVPYEPYKAAITPLVAPLRKKNSKEEFRKNSKEQQHLGQTQEKSEENTSRIETPTCDEIDAKENNVRSEEKPSVEEPNSELNREMENEMKVGDICFSFSYKYFNFLNMMVILGGRKFFYFYFILKNRRKHSYCLGTLERLLK